MNRIAVEMIPCQPLGILKVQISNAAAETLILYKSLAKY
jgi:hypothetical protein